MTRKLTPHKRSKDAPWTVEPVPASVEPSARDLRALDPTVLAALLAAAYGRIRALETQMSELQARPR